MIRSRPWISAALISTLLLSTTGARLGHAFLVDKISAGVNSDVILNSDIDRFQRTSSLRRELDPLFGFSDELAGEKANRSKILDFLIQERLITQTFKVEDKEVEQEIQSVQRNNNLQREDLTGFLKQRGYDFSDYFELMRTGLAKRNLLDREIRSRVNISDDDVRNYIYNTTMKNSSTPMEYSLQLISINYKTYKTPKAAQDAADSALRAIRQGESFAEVAKRVSDDTSAQQGGELGFLSAEALAEPLRSTAKKLEIGAISDVLKAPSGYMIIKLVDARSAETEKYNELKEKVREQLAKEEYKKQLLIWAERARNDAYVHIN